jgi:UDP-2,3-diacylglucosamine hydrolase
LSDAHLGYDTPLVEQEKEAMLISFLRSLHGKAQSLYLVGDLFDFWFEYKSVVPRKHARTLFELYRLIVSGTKVVYLGGNHDFWLGTYLTEEVGIAVSFTPIEVHHQGLRLYIAHGDGLLSKDGGYRLLKRVLRSRICIALFRLLHPDFGAFLANLVSRSSRVYRNAPEEPFCLDQGYLEAAQEKFNQGFDAAIFGHIHYPIHHTTPKTLIVLGDWIQHFSYAVLEDGRFELRRWEHPELGSIESDSETVTCQQSSGIIEDGLA